MKINLNKNMFTEKEYMLLSHGNLKVFAFKYSSGIEALRIENEKGYFIILPFKGQQIWKLHFAGFINENHHKRADRLGGIS